MLLYYNRHINKIVEFHFEAKSAILKTQHLFRGHLQWKWHPPKTTEGVVNKEGSVSNLNLPFSKPKRPMRAVERFTKGK